MCYSKLKASQNIEAIATKVPQCSQQQPKHSYSHSNLHAMVEAGLSDVNAIFAKQMNRLNLQNRGDLRLLLTFVVPNINNLAAAHQAHISYYKGV